MSVAADLRALRSAGWKDERIAAAIGCSARSISSWRKGAPPLDVYAVGLEKLAAKLRRRSARTTSTTATA